MTQPRTQSVDLLDTVPAEFPDIPAGEHQNSSANPEYMACLECDLLLDYPELEEGERANCPRCGWLVASRPRDGLRFSLAFSLAALMLMIMANAFPFLTFSKGGLEQVMTLPASAFMLHEAGREILAIVVLLFIILAPAIMISAMILTLAPLVFERSVSWLRFTGRIVFALSPWSMVEVYIVGVLVTLFKIASMAKVEAGISFWAYIVFTACFVAAQSHMDTEEVWREIERRSP